MAWDEPWGNSESIDHHRRTANERFYQMVIPFAELIDAQAAAGYDLACRFKTICCAYIAEPQNPAIRGLCLSAFEDWKRDYSNRCARVWDSN